MTAAGSSNQGAGVKNVNAEALNAAQRETAQRYIKISSSRGVLVGALLGPGTWDVRPMLLEQGQLFLLRFSAYHPPLNDEMFGSFRTVIERRLHSDSTANTQIG